MLIYLLSRFHFNIKLAVRHQDINKKYIFENPFIEITRTCYSNGVIMHPHSHEHSAISLILTGSIHETVHDKTGFGGIANVVIKPSEIVHNNLFSSDCTILSIYLKHENFNKIRNQDMLKEWAWINGGNCQYFFSELINCQTENDYYNSLNTFLKHLSHQKNKTEFKAIPEWLAAVKSHIESCYHEVIRSKDLAKVYGVHPVYLSRMFKAHFGQSVKSYLKTLRVNGTMASIINEDDILAQVALKNGFSDQSHLNRDFKPATGLTPYEFKNLMK